MHQASSLSKLNKNKCVAKLDVKEASGGDDVEYYGQSVGFQCEGGEIGEILNCFCKSNQLTELGPENGDLDSGNM